MVEAAGTMKPSKLVGGNSVVEVVAADLLLLCSVNYSRTDVEGCCWCGRGVIQSTGVCNFGKLNFYISKMAKDEGRCLHDNQG